MRAHPALTAHLAHPQIRASPWAGNPTGFTRPHTSSLPLRVAHGIHSRLRAVTSPLGSLISPRFHERRVIAHICSYAALVRQSTEAVMTSMMASPDLVGTGSPRRKPEKEIMQTPWDPRRARLIYFAMSDTSSGAENTVATCVQIALKPSLFSLFPLVSELQEDLITLSIYARHQRYQDTADVGGPWSGAASACSIPQHS